MRGGKKKKREERRKLHPSHALHRERKAKRKIQLLLVMESEGNFA